MERDHTMRDETRTSPAVRCVAMFDHMESEKVGKLFEEVAAVK